MNKKTLILSLMAFVLCAIMISLANGVKKPIPAKELAFAEEVVQWTLEDEDIQDTQEEEIREETEDDICISIIGKAKLTLKPDIATITACIEKFNEDITLSKNENLEILNKVKQALEEQGIGEDKIILEYFSAHPTYDHNAGKQPVGYYSKSCFSFKIENLDNIPTVIDILTENGVTDICDVCYQLSNIEEEYNNALLKAIENAKSKAVKITGNENIEITDIKEEMVYSCSSLCRQYVENLNLDMIGQVEIEAKVNIVFKSN